MATTLTGTAAAGRARIVSSAVWRGLGWSASAQVAGMSIRLASSLLLTRLLTPEAYGIMGIAMAFATMLEWISDIGVTPALVRHERGGERRFLAAAWWMNFLRSAAQALALAAAAWPLAAAYRAPELFIVLLLLAVRPLLYGMRSPGMPSLRRRLDYRRLFFDELLQTAAGTVVSIVLACWWRDVNAIVVGSLAGAGAAALFSYRLAPGRPFGAWDSTAARELRGLGNQVFVNTLVMAAWLNLDRLIGRMMLSDLEIGLYAVSLNLAVALELFLSRCTDVYYATMARRSPAERENLHARVLQWSVRAVMPALALAAAAAPALFRGLYDARYHAAAATFGLLVVRIIPRILGQIEFQKLMADGSVRASTQAYFVAAIAQIATLPPLIALFGSLGLPLAALLSTVLVTVLQTLRGSGNQRALIAALVWTAAASWLTLSVAGCGWPQP